MPRSLCKPPINIEIEAREMKRDEAAQWLQKHRDDMPVNEGELMKRAEQERQRRDRISNRNAAIKRRARFWEEP
jgi:hypothetical protein